MKNEEKIYSLLNAQAHEDRLEDCFKSHPCLSWSVLISTLIRAKEKEAAKIILQNHEFQVKGYSYNYCVWLNILYVQLLKE